MKLIHLIQNFDCEPFFLRVKFCFFVGIISETGSRGQKTYIQISLLIVLKNYEFWDHATPSRELSFELAVEVGNYLARNQ